MWRVLVVVVWPVLAVAAEPGSRAEYIGGTLSDMPKTLGGRLLATDDLLFSFQAGDRAIRIPYDRINLLEYGQKADRRYLMAVLVSPIFILSKKRSHFLTIGYADDAGRQQALVFRLEKKSVRGVLASLEARTGRKVQYQDEEARKGGKD